MDKKYQKMLLSVLICETEIIVIVQNLRKLNPKLQMFKKKDQDKDKNENEGEDEDKDEEEEYLFMSKLIIFIYRTSNDRN